MLSVVMSEAKCAERDECVREHTADSVSKGTMLFQSELSADLFSDGIM